MRVVFSRKSEGRASAEKRFDFGRSENVLVASITALEREEEGGSGGGKRRERVGWWRRRGSKR